jgi:hypothetical protein
MIPETFFIFDAESVGLHGEGFAVAGGVYRRDGGVVREFAFHCQPMQAAGVFDDRKWVAHNVTIHKTSLLVANPEMVRIFFWGVWMRAKLEGATMFVECGWPVEAAFLEACIKDQPSTRNWDGPYPMHEIASIMLAAGMDPMATYERREDELPAHEPLADSRLSARLLFEALEKLGV